MKRLFQFLLFSALGYGLSAAEADLKADVKNAVAQLGQQPNYSWISTAQTETASPNLRLGPTEGKTEKNGFTYFKLTLGEDTVEAAFRGIKSAIKMENDWESSQGLQGERAWIARRLSAFKAPAAEADDLLAKTQWLRKEKGGAYAGDLTQAGVKELLAMRSRENQSSSPSGAKGWAKFWLKNGVLVRYQYNVQGKLPGPNQQEFQVNRTTTVEIKDVGSTKLQLPEEARKKL